MSDGTIDLGNEPPLSLGNEPREAPAKRAVSMRWLGGTILTGVTSIFLMGGALTAALDNPNQFASLPEALADTAGADENEFGQKSDRIQPIEEEIEGLYAVCFQHELDHLNGVLFIDHLSRLRRERAVAKVKKNARLAA